MSRPQKKNVLETFFAEKYSKEAEWARPHAGEMLVYLRALLDDPSHVGVKRCARELIKQIEDDAKRNVE
jgi:hypothetical protein